MAKAIFGALTPSFQPNTMTPLEYFVVLIDGGPISAKFALLQEQDTLLLDKTVTGFLFVARALWLMAAIW